MTLGEIATHKVFLPRWKWRRVLVAVAIALCVWSLDFMGASPTLCDLGYDSCLRISSRNSNGPARVLLVYVDQEHLSGNSEAPESLSRALLGLGAHSIGFTCPLAEPTTGLVELARETGAIVLAREFHANPVDPNKLDLSSATSAVSHLPIGLVGVAPGCRGIYRSHFGSLVASGSQYLSLEAILAQKVSPERGAIPSGDFRIAFRGGPGSLPHVDYESVVGGDLVRGLVEGKVVLIGLTPPHAFPGISTPTTRGHAKMSLLEYHGHVLQTLLVTGPIYEAPLLTRLLLLVISALLCHFVFQAVGFKWCLPIVAALLLLDASIAIIPLGWFSLWIPCAPLVFVQACCFAEVYLTKFRLCEQAVVGVLLDQSIKLRRRRIPMGFYSTETPWQLLTSLIHQQFHLTRLVVLERPTDSDYLNEVHAVNCGVDAIDERRRDCQRWPYSAAFESKLPLRLDTNGYSFLTDQDPGEHQYLYRLAFNGEVLGFLVLGVAATTLEACPDFRLRLQSTADEFAALLHRWRWVQSQRDSQRTWYRRLHGIPEVEPFRQLGRANHLFENRLGRLEKSFESSDTGCAIYDLFGQLLMMNSQLSQLLHAKGIVPSKLSSLDLLCALTGRELNDCRNLLQGVAGDKRAISLQIAMTDPVRVFQLNIHPLQLDSSPATVLPEEADPFQLHGIHIELIDGTPFVELHDVKDHITDRLCHDLSQNLDAVQHLVAQLSHDIELPDKYQEVGETVEDSLLQAVAALQECRGFVNSDLIHDPGERVPLDAAAALRLAVDTIAQRDERDVDVRVLLPDVVGDVLANPRFVESTFTALLHTLLSGKSDKPVITIHAEEDVDETSFVLGTTDASVSADELRKVLINGEETAVGEFRELREVRDWIDQWGGRMVVATGDEYGILIKLVLKRHHWMSSPRLATSDQAKEAGTPK